MSRSNKCIKRIQEQKKNNICINEIVQGDCPLNTFKKLLNGILNDYKGLCDTTPTKQVQAKINKIDLNTKKDQLDAIRELATEANKLAQFNARYDKTQKNIIDQINNISANTDTIQLNSIRTSSVNFDLDNKFNERYKKVQNQIQAEINKINLNTDPKTLSILDKQAEGYNLGSGIATIKYAEVTEEATKQQAQGKINALTHETTKETRKTVEQDLEKYGLTDEYNARVNIIETEIRNKISQLTIDSDRIVIDSIKALVENYNLIEDFDTQYNKLQKEVKTKINALKADTDENIIESVNKTSINFNLTSEFNIQYNTIRQKAESKEQCIEKIEENASYFKTTQKQIDPQTTLETLKEELKETWFFSFPKLAEEKKFYAILGLNPDATVNEIKRAYYKMSLKLHPDKSTGNTETKKTKEEVFNFLELVVDAKTHLKKDHIPLERYEETVNALVYETEQQKQERITTEETWEIALQNVIWIQENCLDSGVITQDLYLSIAGQLTDQIDDM